MKKVVSVVIPVYNEEFTIQKVLDEVLKETKKIKKFRFEYIVVNNNSTDKTKQIVSRYKNVKVFDEKRKGKGFALRCGFANSKGDYIVMLDGDFSHMASDMQKLISNLDKNRSVGLVIANRKTGGSDEYNFVRAFGNYFLTFSFNLFFGHKLTDALNGYKCFKREIFDDFEYYSSNFEIEIEIIANTIRKGLKVMEVPSFERERAGGKMKSLAIIHGPKFLMRIIIEWFKYKILKR